MALIPVPRHRLWLVALVTGLVAVGGYFLLPHGRPQSLGYDVIGLAFGVLILVGVRVHRPARPGLWYWLAAGQITSVTGDVVWEIYQDVLHQQPFPSLADVFYLAAYPMIATGLLLLVRARQGRDPAALIDAAVVATGLGMVFWVFVLHPVVTSASDSLLASVINTAYPAADAVLLVILARLFTGASVGNTSSRLIGAAALLLLFADVGYSLVTQYLSFSGGDPLDALFLGSYICWGVGALHPSMADTRTSRPVPTRRPVGMGRLLLLTASSLLAPAMLFLPGMRANLGDWLVVSSGAVVLFVLVAVRMSGFIRQVQQQARELERLALRDALTGLPNRRRLEQEMRTALAAGASCVALLDLTGFKKVNDRLGHNVGDLLLVEIARRLSRAIGDGDSVARLGGDEFAVLVGGDRERADRVAERITRALAEPVRTGGHELLIGANIGLASAAGITEPLEALRRADVAMYAAKEHGEPYRWYGAELDEHLGVEAELRTALAAGQLRLVYQPIVELPTARLVSVEALVRWHHPERGVLSPAEFIPVAERSGLIVEMGEWILREACRRLAAWRAEGGPDAPQRVSVNVSAKQLEHLGLAGVVASALADHDLPPGCLTIEVTETAVFDGVRARQTLADLVTLGVRIALDDFGTGHSSLTLLQTVPAHALKVDKSFIDEIAAGGRPAVIAAALIQVADGLGLTAVAEGVETAEQAAELHRLGYRLAQGYHFGRPAEHPAVTGGRTAPMVQA